jgi:hypothetical protein
MMPPKVHGDLKIKSTDRLTKRMKRALLILIALFGLASLILIHGRIPSDKPDKRQKTVVMFAYYECGIYCAQNLNYFMNVAIWDNDVDYIIISNGKCSVCTTRQDVFDKQNVKLIERENIGYDFGAYAAAIKSIDIRNYDYFIFVNAGIRGPLIPGSQMSNLMRWHTYFTNRVVGSTKLVGATISCEIQIHVQSYMFALHIDGLELALANGVFPEAATSIDALISNSEIGMSSLLLSHGFNIDTLMTEYSGRNWTKIWTEKLQVECNDGRNPTTTKLYHGIDLSIYEAMFFKFSGNTRTLCKDRVCDSDKDVHLATGLIEDYVVRNFPDKKIVKTADLEIPEE